MAANNLRIIYDNLVDLSTTSITASSTMSTAYSVTNMAKNAKGLVWRSGTFPKSTTFTSGTITDNTVSLAVAGWPSSSVAISSNNLALGMSVTSSTIDAIPPYTYITGLTLEPTDTYVLSIQTNNTLKTSSSVVCTGNKVILKVDLGSNQKIGGVILGFTNLLSTYSTVSISGYTSDPTLGGTTSIPTVSGTALFTQSIRACPWNSLTLPNYNTNPSDSTTYAYGGGTHARVWLDSANQQINIRYLSIEITSAATNNYIEISRLIIGRYWSPKYNTGYGITNTITDMTTSERTGYGDLVSQIAPRYSTLNFNLESMHPTDHAQLSTILRSNGITKPLFTSIFPDNGTSSAEAEMERIHQIYGKLSDISGIRYTALNNYSTQVNIEEV